MRRRLTGMRVLVTGGSAGVGQALATALVDRGARVLATARRADRLERLVASCAGGDRLLVEAGDITSTDFRHQLVAAAAERLGGLDIVAGVAGRGAIGRFASADPATLAEVLAVNFTAPAELVRLCLPLLRRGRDPAIVLVGSILGYYPLPLHSEYCAAKAALRSLATSLRMELEPEGIDVLLASLGPTASEFWDHLTAGRRPTWSRGRQLPAPTVATAIVKGLERHRREILPGWRAKGFAGLARLLPGLLGRVIASRVAGAASTDDDRSGAPVP
jgi:uncharacterized oxidoreductase